jgi:hypothetical protein
MNIDHDDRPEIQQLFANLKTALPELEALLADNSGEWTYEDPIYRFYHGSFKVFGLQGQTATIVEKLQALLPDQALNPNFNEILRRGTGKAFGPGTNAHWTDETAPILEAFFHAKYFLEMAVRYGNKLEYPPRLLPSGWAAFLYLYELR